MFWKNTVSRFNYVLFEIFVTFLLITNIYVDISVTILNVVIMDVLEEQGKSF